MHRTERIADSYRAATVKGAWYGPSLAELLAQISPELATTPPVPGSNSLPRWQPEKDWAEPPIPWNELVSCWSQSRELLEEKIRNFPVEDLAKQVPGRDYPYETMLHGIVEHAIYHSGHDGIEHAPAAIPVAPAERAISFPPICSLVRF
jgi:hypothetical protein